MFAARPSLSVAWFAALAMLLVAGSAAAQRRYVAPSRETVFSTTEERAGDAPVHVIFVENRSTVPITVFSVSLTRCENVKERCAPRATKLRIRPGQRSPAARVEPANPQLGFMYSFGFGWHADSAGNAALGLLAANGSAARSCPATTSRRSPAAR